MCDWSDLGNRFFCAHLFENFPKLFKALVFGLELVETSMTGYFFVAYSKNKEHISMSQHELFIFKLMTGITDIGKKNSCKIVHWEEKRKKSYKRRKRKKKRTKKKKERKKKRLTQNIN